MSLYANPMCLCPGLAVQFVQPAEYASKIDPFGNGHIEGFVNVPPECHGGVDTSISGNGFGSDSVIVLTSILRRSFFTFGIESGVITIVLLGAVAVFHGPLRDGAVNSPVQCGVSHPVLPAVLACGRLQLVAGVVPLKHVATGLVVCSPQPM